MGMPASLFKAFFPDRRCDQNLPFARRELAALSMYSGIAAFQAGG